MESRLRHVAGCVVALLVALPAFAQFGHPLKGTWSGDWGPTKDKQTRVLLEFHWDGKEITGKINPGPKAVPFQKVTLDAPTWMVHIEAEGKDASGAPLRYVIDGKLENIGSARRVLSGVWTQAGQKADFRLIRN